MGAPAWAFETNPDAEMGQSQGSPKEIFQGLSIIYIYVYIYIIYIIIIIIISIIIITLYNTYVYLKQFS